jgi:hypothetical protein
MAANTIPFAREPFLTAEGLVSPSWYRYLANLGQRAPFVADLAASPTVEQISTAFNALLDGLQTSGQQESS